MPVINIELADLDRLLVASLTADEFLATVSQLGADPDGIDDGVAAVEFFPDRPDLCSTEGVARALRAFTGQRPGLPRYDVAEAATHMTVAPAVLDVRPVMRGALVHGVQLDDAAIRSLMELQEKLHLTVGRRRRKVSIGLHDLAPLEPPFTYGTCTPEEPAFIPLGCESAMTPAQVLAEHPKGVDYAHLLEGHHRYPLITDAKGTVASLPPIINGVATTVNDATTDLLIDVTGHDAGAVEACLNIVATALVERGGRLTELEVRYPDRTMVTPDLAPRRHAIAHDRLVALLGDDPGAAALAKAFARCALASELRDGTWEVEVPAYRADLLHPVDLVEEAAIGLGFDWLPARSPQAVTFGRALASRRREARAREALLGFGFQEVVTLTLGGSRTHHALTGRAAEGVTCVANPVGEEYDLLRPALLPGLLGLLRTNRHHELPQRVFEVGWIVSDHHNRQALAWVELAGRAPFARARSLAESVARRLGVAGDPAPDDDPLFIAGRCARVVVGDAELVYGEIHPRVLTGFELGHPALGGELRW